MPTYAILGAAGKVGFATSQALRDAGVSVRAILRDESKAARLRSIGCDIATADLHDADALAKALEHADAVQVILPPAPGTKDPAQDMRDVMESVVTALEKAGPKRLLAISDYGAHVSDDIGMPTMFRTLEERLGRLGGHKLFLRSAEQMENWARDIPSAVASGTLLTLHDPVDKPFPNISAADVGSIAAQLLLLPVDGEGTEVVHAEGPRRYSASDVAAALGEIMGRTIDVEAIPRSQWSDHFGRILASSLVELIVKANDAQNAGGLVDIEPGSSNIRHGTTELVEALRPLARPLPSDIPCLADL